MGKISQSAAEMAAHEIAAPLLVKVQELKKQLSDYVTEVYLKDVPVEVKKLNETHPFYIEKTINCYVTGQGLSSPYYINFAKGQPTSNGYRPTITLTAKEAEKVVKLKDQIEDIEKKYKNTKQEIENTLLTLGTHKKIGEVMPNALRFLPETKQNTRELVVQIQPIVDKVNCLITNEDKCVDKL